MRLDRYERVDDFLAAAGPWLTEREAEHNLILGVADSAGRSPELFEGSPYLAVVRDREEVLAAALRTPPYNLIVSEVDDTRVLPLLADDAAASLPGVVGPPDAIRAFADQWVGRHGGTWQVRMEERIYALSAVVTLRAAAGGMRDAAASDEALLVRWLESFAAEALAGELPGQMRRPLEEWRRGNRRFWLWEDGSEPVSLVGAGARTPNGIRIGPVYTPPGRRGRGYASALTAGVSALLLAEGRRFCFLYTDLANPTSNRIYQAIGYRPVADALMVAFGP